MEIVLSGVGDIFHCVALITINAVSYTHLAVATLPEKEKQVVTMYYYERLKYSEIAKVMSITQSRVCQIHSKAMLTLKNKLESYING